MRFLCTAVPRQVLLSTVLLKTLLHDRCGCDPVYFHRSPAQCFNRLGIRLSHVRCELERPLRSVLVFTSECRSFANRSSVYECCCDLRHRCDLLSSIHQSSLRLHQTCHQRVFQISSELPASLRLECCFVIGSAPDVAPLPRLRIFLICLVSLDTNCSSTPQYTCQTCHQRFHIRSHLSISHC